MAKKYTFSVNENELEIQPNKINLFQEGITYSIFITVALYFIIKLNDYKNNFSTAVTIVLSFFLSIPLALIVLKFTKSYVKIQKKDNRIYFRNCELLINEISEIRLEEYISSEVVTGITSIYFVTKFGKYKVLPSVKEKDLDEIVQCIISFLGVNSNILTKHSS